VGESGTSVRDLGARATGLHYSAGGGYECLNSRCQKENPRSEGYDSAMLRRLALFMVVTISLTGCRLKSFTYELREPQPEGEYSSLHTMPDGALLVLTKREEQPKQIWNLRRIVAWDTSEPREDDLEVDVGPNDELWPPFESDLKDRSDQLLMDPGGNYLVVRFAPDIASWNQNFGESAKSLRSVLNIIDLHNFKLLSRVVVTDPLLAAGDMGFSPNGTFVVSGAQERTSATIDDKVATTGHFAVETLTLPALKPETLCSYTITTKPYIAGTPSTPKEAQLLETQHWVEVERQRDQDQAAEQACGPKLTPLGFSSLNDVREKLNWWELAVDPAEPLQNVPPQSPWGCQCQDLSPDLKYALYDCDEGRVQITFFFRYRGFRVFRLADGSQIMDLKVAHRPEYSGVLAAKGGVTYVVLLRDGAELEGYRLP